MSRFKFDFVKEEDMNGKNILLSPGEASFKVNAIFDTKKDGSPLTTMDGTPKLTLSLNVIDCNGKVGFVYDDLTSKTAWKIKGILDAVGMSHLYTENGEFCPEDLLHTTGRCMIEVKSNPGYDDKTTVKRYLKPKVTQEKVDYSKDLPIDDIPF